MASPQSPKSRGKNCELSEEGRTALALRYAWALPPGKERLPAGVGPKLAAEFGVGERYPRKVWASMKEELDRGHDVSLRSARRSGRPSDFTPRKQAKIREINAGNRTLTVNQLSSKLAEVGLDVGSSKLHNWLKVMGATRVQRRITPSLSLDHEKNRVDLILDQVSRDRKTFKTGFNTIHVDEAWFYLIRDKEKVRMFPGEEKVGSIKVQHKSHIPKVMFICAVSRPDPSRDFDGKIGIWRVCVIKEAQRSTARHKKGEEYAVDVTIDSEYYQEWYEHELLPAIKEKMPWLKSGGVVVQQDGASPETGKGTEEKLNRVGKEEGVGHSARDATCAVTGPQH